MKSRILAVTAASAALTALAAAPAHALPATSAHSITPGMPGTPGTKLPGPCTRDVPVVFVHGFLMNGDNSWVGLQDALRAQGWCTYAFTYGAVGTPLPVAGFGSQAQGARELAAMVDRARRETGSATVHFVTHSKGAAVAAEYIAAHPGAVSRVVNIAGVAASLPANFPGPPGEPVPAPSPQVTYLNIASRWDVVVPNQASLPRCSTCTSVLISRPVGHVGLLYDPEIRSRTVNFLAQ